MDPRLGGAILEFDGEASRASGRAAYARDGAGVEERVLVGHRAAAEMSDFAAAGFNSKSNLVWDLIKPVSTFALHLKSKPL